jgi:hypothetical protein
MIGDRWGAVRALLFDVQGTATDFYSTVRDEAQRISNGRHPQMDWGGFVDRWRAAYFTALKAASPSGSFRAPVIVGLVSPGRAVF